MTTPHKLAWFAPGLIGGLLIGTLAAGIGSDNAPAESKLGSIIGERIEQNQYRPVSCAADVDTEGWATFRDRGLAIEFKYPPSYSVESDEDTVTLTPLDKNPDGTIKMEKIRSSLAKEVNRDWQMATWKIADRKTFAMTSAYFTDDNDKLWSTYLFVRDFPLGNGGSTFPMVRATIYSPLSAEEYAKGQQAGTVDFENLLTLPEQILSTFRFLQNEELS